MTRLVHVLVAAAAALSSASGTSLIPSQAGDILLQVKAPLQLDCGVEGPYRHCYWETHDGRFFQVEDVHAGLHAGVRAPHTLTHNQCGIVVENTTVADVGEWSCHVLLEEEALKGVRTVGRACTPPFESLGTGCYYFSEIVTNIWEEARTFCKSLSPNADLAVLDDCHQFQLVWNHILVNFEPTAHWIGATDEHLDGQFYWVDGTSVDLGTPFWYPNYPRGQHCVEMSAPYGYYVDDPCTDVHHFVCEVP